MSHEMRCLCCGRAWWSAGAGQMVERGEPCSACGGPLRLLSVDDRGEPAPAPTRRPSLDEAA